MTGDIGGRGDSDEQQRSDRLLGDGRARVPFAIIAVLLLVSAVALVGYLETRGSAETDTDASLAMDRTDASIQTTLRDATASATQEAAAEPLTAIANTSWGGALDPGRPFVSYLKGLVYLEARERFAAAGQRVGDVETTVSLAPITDPRVILDAELVGYTPETIADEPTAREPLAFQQLSRRIKLESDIEATARELPVVAHIFDCLYEDGSLLSKPFRERRDRVDAVTTAVTPEPAAGVAGFERARSVTVPETDPEAATALYREALAAGHEGVMLKNPGAVYQPGRRVGRLLKLKPTMEPLDLVVTRAKYSEGRRSQMLGRLYLGCHDPETGDLLEVGRLSTGYTDDELERLTDKLEGLVVDQSGRAVELEPSVVLEVEYEEIQESPEYGSGYALRFPRYLRTRESLAPEDADSIDRVERLYGSQ